MKVKATKKYEELQVTDNELGRIPKEGEEFFVTEERYKLLTHNSFGVAFVEEILEKVEPQVVEVEKVETKKVERAVKPVKKVAKKSKK